MSDASLERKLMKSEEQNWLEELEHDEEFQRELAKLHELAARRGISAAALLLELLDSPSTKRMLAEMRSSQ